MITLSQIESDLTQALKARNQIAADTLRALKTRMQNEKIAKQHDLEAPEILALVRSEVKRRKEASAMYEQGGRADLASKEQAEIAVLQNYLPPEISEDQIVKQIDTMLAAEQLTQKDFGKAMAILKQAFPDADGSVLSKILKEKLK